LLHQDLGTFLRKKSLNLGLNQLKNEKNIRVLVIKGAGKSFCAGIDLSEFFGKSLHEYRGWVGLMEQMAQIIACMKKEVVDPNRWIGDPFVRWCGRASQ
jgi:hypothetical protein